jgi:hypothetical protein
LKFRGVSAKGYVKLPPDGSLVEWKCGLAVGLVLKDPSSNALLATAFINHSKMNA